MSTRIVKYNTEMSILNDQIVAAKKVYGENAFDLMADPDGNQEQLIKVYQEAFKTIGPRQEKVAEKLAKRDGLSKILHGDEPNSEPEPEPTPDADAEPQVTHPGARSTCLLFAFLLCIVFLDNSSVYQ